MDTVWDIRYEGFGCPWTVRGVSAPPVSGAAHREVLAGQVAVSSVPYNMYFYSNTCVSNHIS